MSLQYGEVSPDALAEYLTLDGGVRVQRGFGDVGSWPAIPDSAAAPAVGTRLAILGPGLQSPKTVRAAGALVRQVSPGVTLGVGGTYRRSEFLLRRNDLNRLVEEVGRDQNDRALYGDLDLRGGVLAADPSTNRRFSEFESVWALDPDGWSEYRAFSVFMDAELRGGARLMADYTYSETTDNMLGAATGRAGAQEVPEIDTPDWEEGVSDFDVPHRLTLTGSVPLPRGGALSVVYRFRSGLPFTPMVAAGLDANGDGSAFNDPAFIPTGAVLDDVAAAWDCVAQGAGALAVRNSCRGDPVSRIDARLAIGLGTPGGMPLRLIVDGLNLTDVPEGIRDDALLIADPNGVVTKSGSSYTVPYAVNPYFGDYVQRTDAGRMIRVGFQIGGGS